VSDAISAYELTKTYGNGVRALSGLSFSVTQGTIFALIGPNGAGKSTAVKILTTLARPDSGTAIVAGYDVRRQPEQVRRRIGAVAQQNISDPYATGRENLRFHGHIHGLRRKRLQQRIDMLIERFELTSAADRMVYEYSGGMRRRLDIAMGFIHEPTVLFLDEPTTGLDPSIRARMWREITQMCSESRVTVLLTSHYLEEVERVADRLAIIHRGRIAAEGTPGSLKSRLGGGDVVVVELDHPVTEGNIAALLRRVAAIQEVQPDGSSIRLRAADGGTVIPGILDSLREQGLGVLSVTMSTPTLDDVYLLSDASGAAIQSGGPGLSLLHDPVSAAYSHR